MAKLKKKRPPKYPRYRTHAIYMGSAGKGKPRRVIDRGKLREYVGIGWILIRAANEDDYLKYPELTDD